MSQALEDILKRCGGVRVETKPSTNRYTAAKYEYKFYKTGDIEMPPEGIYIEILKTATKGTIARIVDVDELETYSERYPNHDKYKDSNQIVPWCGKFTYEVDGRKQTGRIQPHHVKVLAGVHTTKYVRNVKKHKKVVVKNPVNKFKQEMQRGDWVIGVARGQRLGIGRITRWTNSNVWAVTGNDLDDKSKEFIFASMAETFTMPDDKHVQLLTMAVLKGWSGR